MNTSSVDAENLITYCASLANELEARRNRIRNFVQHNLTSGTANEAILRDFLSHISAGVCEIAQGFICNPMRSTASKQCDILVYDRRFPLVYSEGEVKIVWPESVLMVAEVKSSMKGREELTTAIENIVSAKKMEVSRHINGLVFAFESLTAPTALEVLTNCSCDPIHRPLAILLFDRGAIIQQKDAARDWRFGGGTSSYELRQCEGDTGSSLVLTYFLLLFLRIQMLRAPGFSSSEDLEMVTHRFLQEKTRLME